MICKREVLGSILVWHWLSWLRYFFVSIIISQIRQLPFLFTSSAFHYLLIMSLFQVCNLRYWENH